MDLRRRGSRLITADYSVLHLSRWSTSPQAQSKICCTLQEALPHSLRASVTTALAPVPHCVIFHKYGFSRVKPSVLINQRTTVMEDYATHSKHLWNRGAHYGSAGTRAGHLAFSLIQHYKAIISEQQRFTQAFITH